MCQYDLKIFWNILEYSGILIVPCEHFCCFTDEEEEEMHGKESQRIRELPLSSESVPPVQDVSPLVAAAMGVPVASNAIQEIPLDVRKLMAMCLEEKFHL